MKTTTQYISFIIKRENNNIYEEEKIIKGKTKEESNSNDYAFIQCDNSSTLTEIRLRDHEKIIVKVLKR